ncbi:30S ribosomal protein S1 [Porphyridium purpureum]|uniref:30S ribosomal protein S1 n=1 Tax=Porphyridium purpureum TaxID=35688 RepID=A0A5J4YZA9_PORPP|nr:30S ribosomal protein S1 [Porphyridium purpureum]|eukprot:POR8655..scf208_2
MAAFVGGVGSVGGATCAGKGRVCGSATRDEARAVRGRRPRVVMQDVAADTPAAVPTPMETKFALADLQPGTQLDGVVRTVTTYGAFVDIGAGTDGLLHVSQMSNAFVKDPNEIVSVGQTISVRVIGVDLEKGNFSLSLREEGAQNDRRAPARGGAKQQQQGAEDRPSWNEYQIPDEKEFVEGKVVSITDFGAFVNFGAPTDGMIHISSISEDRVASVKSVLSVGQTVQVRVLEADPARNRVSLSMTPWVPEEERKSSKRRSAPSRSSEPVDVEGRASSEEISKFMEGQPEHESPFAIAWNRAQGKQ